MKGKKNIFNFYRFFFSFFSKKYISPHLYHTKEIIKSQEVIIMGENLLIQDIERVSDELQINLWDYTLEDVVDILKEYNLID